MAEDVVLQVPSPTNDLQTFLHAGKTHWATVPTIVEMKISILWVTLRKKLLKHYSSSVRRHVVTTDIYEYKLADNISDMTTQTSDHIGN